MKYPETSKRLNYILNLRKMTAQELSKKSGVGKSSISHYVNGSNEPHNKNAGLMAEVLNVNPQWLMGFNVDMAVYDNSLADRVLNDEEEQMLTLFQHSTPEMRKAALAVLKAGQPSAGHQELPHDKDEGTEPHRIQEGSPCHEPPRQTR